MSVVSGSGACRMTLGTLASRYGYELVPPSSEGVTVTSLADEVDSVIPGSLYVPAGSVNMERLEHAAMRGAYAALVPQALRGAVDRLSMPLVLGECDDASLAAMAQELTSAKTLAMFACYGEEAGRVQRQVEQLSEFLHVLGNPVGVISAADTQSLEQYIGLHYPLGVLDVQRVLSVCAEDGANAVIVSMDERTLRRGALHAVGLDVFGVDDVPDSRLREACATACDRYGCVMDERGKAVGRTAESDALARQADEGEHGGSWEVLSLAIAMAMAAGVRRANIRSALRVSRELS